jgi:hypothetical protein
MLLVAPSPERAVASPVPNLGVGADPLRRAPPVCTGRSTATLGGLNHMNAGRSTSRAVSISLTNTCASTLTHRCRCELGVHLTESGHRQDVGKT